MKKLLVIIAVLLLGAGPLHAQKTKAQITTEITALFPDNAAGQITPLGLRTVTNDIATSIMPTAPVTSGNLACFSGTTGLLQDCGSSPTPNAITALTGDITATGPGSVAATLATVNANTGAWGSATQAPQFTVNGKGLITAAANVTVTPAVGSITGLGTGIATALGVNVGTAGAPVVNGGVLGTPSSGTLTNATGLPTTGLTGTLQAAQEPAHTGDVTNTAGSLALTIAANAVTNAKMATMNAFTLKGNATGSGAAPTDISIPALTQKVSPAAGDFIMIADSAASNALKYALVSSIASAGSVSSIAGNTGAFTLSTGITNSANDIRLSLTNATLQSAATTPAGTSSGTQVMMGLGVSQCRIAPVYSTRIKVEVVGWASNSSTNITTAQLRYGTGAGPANNAAPTGTAVGSLVQGTSAAANAQVPFNIGAIVSGLSAGTTYWLDLSFSTNGGTSQFQSVSCNAMEF